jgi:hypothetical protein
MPNVTVHTPDAQTAAGEDPSATAAVGEPTTAAVKIPAAAAATTNLRIILKPAGTRATSSTQASTLIRSPNEAAEYTRRWVIRLRFRCYFRESGA